MKTLAGHHTISPHGESRMPISISVLMTFLFIGCQWVIFVLTAVATRMNEPTLFSGANPFTVSSLVIAALLLVFLAVDLRRIRLDAHGGSWLQYVVFAFAGVLLALFMIFMVRVIQYSGPAA
ncbi:MAG: hypothetical protein PVJ49_00715 [Acidobacteriota bacterium]|jgi:hypothetical protein